MFNVLQDVRNVYERLRYESTTKKVFFFLAQSGVYEVNIVTLILISV